MLPENIKENTSSKFNIGQNVYVSGNKRWIKGEVKETIGKLMYLVETSQGLMRRHQNQMKINIEAANNNQQSNTLQQRSDNIDFDILPSNDQLELPTNPSTVNINVPHNESDNHPTSSTTTQQQMDVLPLLNNTNNKNPSNATSNSEEPVDQLQTFINSRAEKHQQQFTPRRSERIRKKNGREPK